MNHKWENCLTLAKRSWGYRRDANIADYMTIEQTISELASTVRYIPLTLISVVI